MPSNKFLYEIPSNTESEDYHHQEPIVGCVANIFKKLTKYNELVTVAEMQSGKTFCMKRLIYMVNKYNDEIKNMGIEIDKHNVYLVLCASSNNLKSQHKTNIPEIAHKIYHLNDIQKFLKNMYEYESLLTTMADSGLIIFDECHCDVENSKIIDRFRSMLKKIAKENKTSFYKVGFSATPYEQIMADYPTVIMYPGQNYYGLRQMFNSSFTVIYQAKNLAEPSKCAELFSEISIDNFYYIIRLPSKKDLAEIVFSNITSQLKLLGSKADSIIYDMDYHGNINEVLETRPKKPTIIYLKNKLRMGEYLNTEYVYMVHDDPNNSFAHTTTQSLIGRCCGYNKKNHRTIIYCDYLKAHEHYKWISNDYDIGYIPSSVKYLTSSGEIRENCFF